MRKFAVFVMLIAASAADALSRIEAASAQAFTKLDSLLRPACRLNYHEEIIEHFDETIAENFVGQRKAVRAVRKALLRLSDDDDDGALKFHFVGPSGTGKSYLAELIARSMFPTRVCPSSDSSKMVGAASGLGAGILGTMFLATGPLGVAAALAASSVGGLATGELYRQKKLCGLLDDWTDSCGVVRVPFVHSNSEENLKRAEFAKLSLNETPHAKLLVLDDFSFCVDKCLTEALEILKFGENLVGVVATTDLSSEGLVLKAGMDYEDALREVGRASEKFQHMKSFRHVPFAPLSERELLKVSDRILRKFKQKMRATVDSRLVEKGMQWRGEFDYDESTAQRLVDSLREAVRLKNARALTEELDVRLNDLLYNPKPLWESIMLTKSRKLSDSNVMEFDCDVELVVDSNGLHLDLVN